MADQELTDLNLSADPWDFFYGVFGTGAGASKRYYYPKVVDVRNCGAECDGTTDDTAAVQAAVNKAEDIGQEDPSFQNGGGVAVMFPPAPVRITSSILFNQNHDKSTVSLVGAGRLSTLIKYQGTGFCFDKPQDNKISLHQIRSMSIHGGASGSCIRMRSMISGLVEDCWLRGDIAVDMAGDSYNSTVMLCDIGGRIGVQASQTIVMCNSIIGCDEGIRAYNAGFGALLNRFEVCKKSLVIGKDPAGADSSLAGFLVQGNSFERNDICIDGRAGAGGVISGNAMTGTVGPTPIPIASMSWSSAGGGTVTVNTVAAHGLTTGNIIYVEGAEPAGYNVSGGLGVTATVTDADTFTYPLAVDPGANTVPGNAYRRVQYGIRNKGLHSTIIGPNTISDLMEQAAIDLIYDSATNLYGVVLQSNASAAPVLGPLGEFKAAVLINGRYLPMLFTNLPGQAGAAPGLVPDEGMQYDLTDCNASSFLAAAAGGGSGSTAHRRVRYNAEIPGWQVVG